MDTYAIAPYTFDYIVLTSMGVCFALFALGYFFLRGTYISKERFVPACIIALILLVLFGFNLLNHGAYGLTLFLGIPFVIGVLAGIVLENKKQNTAKSYLTVLYIFLGILGGLALTMLLTGAEGIICIVMAAPIVGISLFGGILLGGWLGRSPHKRKASVYLWLLLLSPTSLSLEHAFLTKIPQFHVETKMVIDAPREAVWAALTQPIDFGTHPDFFFRMGVTYPARMQVVDTGEQRWLDCTYNNGQTRQSIDAFIPNELLLFRFSELPAPMRELSFYDHVDAPHLKGYLDIGAGQFRLTALSTTQTEITAVTDYRYNLQPAPYWELWTDYLFDHMHQHVLAGIKRQAEAL